jgi:hypothetical protein
MNATMIARFLGNGHLSSGISVPKIGKIMRFKKYRMEIRHNTTFYRVVEINYQDQQIYLQDDSKNEDEEELQKPEPEELELPF